MKLTKEQYKKILENQIPFVLKSDDNNENFVWPVELSRAYVYFCNAKNDHNNALTYPSDDYTPFVLDWFEEHDEYFLSNTSIYKLKNFLKNNK